MKKLLLLTLLFITVSVSAQFKFGAIGGVGIGSESTDAVLDSFTVVYGGGPLIEYGGRDFSIRTGAVFQSNEQILIPLQGIIKSSRQGGFIGLGASFNVLRKDSASVPGTFDLILGNKVARNIDFSVGFSYPMNGNLHDAVVQIRMCIFPLSTCKEACGF